MYASELQCPTHPLTPIGTGRAYDDQLRRLLSLESRGLLIYLVRFDVAVAEIFAWLDNISDPLLQYLRFREASIVLAVPNLRASNSHTEHAAAGPLRRHESNAAEQPALFLLGAAKCAQEPMVQRMQPAMTVRSFCGKIISLRGAQAD